MFTNKLTTNPIMYVDESTDVILKNLSNSKLEVIERICKREQINIEYLNKNEDHDYWVGPYGCLISRSLNSCVAGDGGNTRYKDGSETEACCMSAKLTKQEWLNKYSTFNDLTNNYYYKK